jgi:spermidine synthase
MSNDLKEQLEGSLGTRNFLPLVGLFAGSGCAALIYEIVWFQMLQLVIGSSAVSLGVLLGTYMGGMCLGSLALPYVVSPQRHPLRVFACIEAFIGVCGVAVLMLVPSIGRLYVAAAGHGFWGILLRGAVCGVCLLPPTMLMGATLPTISRWVNATPQGASWLGFFYGGNIAGATAGCLLTGFYLLRVYDVVVATWLAVAINAAVAATALVLASALKFNPENIQHPTSDIQHPSTGHWMSDVGCRMLDVLSPRAVYIAIALSGASALGAEVIWTRLLSLMLGATVYAFSIILAIFLIGLGIGSALGSALARQTALPGRALGICQFLLAGAVALAAHLMAESLPYWPINPSLSRSPWLNFQLDLARCAWAVLPATCLWGASFPLALAAAATPGQEPGRWVGRTYAANTLGAIIGALVCSLVLMQWLGSQQAQRLLIGICALAGLVMIVPHLLGQRGQRSVGVLEYWSAGKLNTPLLQHSSTPLPPTTTSTLRCPNRQGRRSLAILRGGLTALAILACMWLLISSVPKVPWELIAYGRSLPTKKDWGKSLYVGEGMNASIAVTETTSGVRNFHVSGKVEASTEAQDMSLQRMLGHLPGLLHPAPRKVLVVGCGAGVTAGSFVMYPTVQRIVICEIEPLIPRVVAGFFAAENYNVLRDPRVEVVYDDARHYVLTTHETFDVITSDPIHPWVKGAATLYTKEYFETVKRHLNPGGLVAQWVPLYESDPAAVQCELATFFEVFPNGTVWGNEVEHEGYDMVLLGQAEPLQIDLGLVQRRLNGENYQRVLKSLRDAGFRSAFSLLSTYSGQASDLRPWLLGAELNCDRNLRLQYLAGMGLNQAESGSIYADMLSYRRFPESVFVGTNEWVRALRLALEHPDQGQEPMGDDRHSDSAIPNPHD